MTALIRFFLGFSLVLTSLFLILLVLIQRGRGGGLAGAFGGAGGQSAFGTKAGDVFTKITVAVAGFWILLCILSLNVLGQQQHRNRPRRRRPPPGRWADPTAGAVIARNQIIWVASLPHRPCYRSVSRDRARAANSLTFPRHEG